MHFFKFIVITLLFILADSVCAADRAHEEYGGGKTSKLSQTSSNPLVEGIEKLECNDPELKSVRFWNFGEPSDNATIRLFNAIGKNTNLEYLEISSEAAMGKPEEWGIRLNNACLRTYKELKKTVDINKWRVGNQAVSAIASAISANTSLKTLRLENALFANEHLSELGNAIKNHPTIDFLTLGIGLGGDVAYLIIQNPRLKKLDLTGNVDLTIPEQPFLSFLSQIRIHPSLQSFCVDSCGDIYIYKNYLDALSQAGNQPNHRVFIKNTAKRSLYEALSITAPNAQEVVVEASSSSNTSINKRKLSEGDSEGNKAKKPRGDETKKD